MADWAPIPRAFQPDMQAADGPPCTFTMSGYFLLESKFLGSSSQPCTRVAPFIQCTFFTSPHAAFISAFRLVSCFQLPIGPAHTSGGALEDWRTIAVINFPLADGADAHPVPWASADSSPVQRVCTAPSLTLTLPKPELPSTFSVKVMRPGALHIISDGEALIFGVRFRAAPPAIGTM